MLTFTNPRRKSLNFGHRIVEAICRRIISEKTGTPLPTFCRLLVEMKDEDHLKTEILLISPDGSDLRCVLKYCEFTADANRLLGENPVKEAHMFDMLTNIIAKEGKSGGGEFILECYTKKIYSNSVFFELEYCPGGDLLQAFQNNILTSLGDKKRLLTEGCKAVAWLHGHGIIHRDISLENFFIGKDNRCRLADFGQACTVAQHNSTPAWHQFGKKKYRAPEQNTSLKYCGKSADIFSLGVTFCCLLTGLTPFGVAHSMDVQWRILQQHGIQKIVTSWRLPFVVPASALDLIGKMMCLQPTRISIEEVLQHPFLAE